GINNRNYYNVFQQGHGMATLYSLDIESVEIINDIDLKIEFNNYIKKNLRMFLSNNPMLGADPEIFIENQNGLISSFDFLNNKSNAVKGKFNSYYGYNDIYSDGFQAEFTVVPGPCLSYVVD